MKEQLLKELKELNAQMDRIVEQGGRILLSDPLFIKAKSIKNQINKL